MILLILGLSRSFLAREAFTKDTSFGGRYRSDKELLLDFFNNRLSWKHGYEPGAHEETGGGEQHRHGGADQPQRAPLNGAGPFGSYQVTQRPYLRAMAGKQTSRVPPEHEPARSETETKHDGFQDSLPPRDRPASRNSPAGSNPMVPIPESGSERSLVGATKDGDADDGGKGDQKHKLSGMWNSIRQKSSPV